SGLALAALTPSIRRPSGIFASKDVAIELGFCGLLNLVRYKSLELPVDVVPTTRYPSPSAAGILIAAVASCCSFGCAFDTPCRPTGVALGFDAITWKHIWKP